MKVSVSNVHEILSRRYKEHKSRYITGGRRGKAVWFYNVENEEFITESIKAAELLFGKDESYYSIAINKYEEPEYRRSGHQLAIRVVDKGLFINLTFYSIVGIELVRSHRQKIAARIKYIEKPLFNMFVNSENGDLCLGLGNRLYSLRFNWWVNKLLSDNEFFRNIMIDFLIFLGNERYIFRDIARVISCDGYLLGGKSYKEIKRYRTPAELMHSISNNRIASNLNKRNLNASFCLMKMTEYIDEKDWGVLAAIPDEKICKWFKPPHLFFHEEDIVYRFINGYYTDKINCETEIIGILANEYVRKCIENNEKISLRFNSQNKITKAVEGYGGRTLPSKMRLDFQIPLIPVDTDFALLRDWLPAEFYWIDTAEKLYEEGVKQHNCVYDYRPRIRQDESTIYHWDKGDKHYTIEFGVDNNNYYIKQMKDRFNRPCKERDWREVESYIM